jgi:aryl-alcohol dehydrogenase-like predicted oxidoreductase
VVVTKGGHYRDGNSAPVDVRPETIRLHCETSLKLLGVDTIELYQLHHPDPSVPITATMSIFAGLRDEGLIRQIGVSNVSVAQLEAARTVVPVASVQNRFSPFQQEHRDVLDYCTEHGIAFLAYSPLSGGSGLLPGPGRLAKAFPAAARVAERNGISVQRLALAWLLALSPVLIPISGASRPETIRDSAAAAGVKLTPEELAELDFAEEGLESAGRVRNEIEQITAKFAEAVASHSS